MAQIDFKDANLVIMDAYSGPSVTPFQVNNVGGYIATNTTMIIDTGTGVIQTGDRFTVVGSTQKHTVTAHTETSGNTTSITFSPGLTGAVADNAIITILPHQVEVILGEGTLTWTETYEREYILNRGRLGSVRNGDETPVEINLDSNWEEIKSVSGATNPTVYEAITLTGLASTWVTTATDPCEPKSVRIRFVHIPSCVTKQVEIVDFNTFRVESVEAEAREATIAFSGKSHELRPTITRAASYVL